MGSEKINNEEIIDKEQWFGTAIDPNQINDYAIFYKGKWISLQNKEHSERFEALRETAVYYPDIYKYKYRGDLKFLFTTYTYPDLDKDTLVSEQCLRRGVAGYYEAKKQTIFFCSWI